MKITDTSDLWWKTAVIYCLDVETYMDWQRRRHRRLRGPRPAASTTSPTSASPASG